MSFFKQPELNILDRYPINKVIPVRDYLCDFILENPLNYPYSSSIMKRTKFNQMDVPIKNYYTKENIYSCIDSYPSYRSDSNNGIYYEMLHSDNICITALLISMFRKFCKCKIIIHQHSPDIIMSISDGSHKHLAMIDKSGSSILCYNTSDSINIYPLFGQHISCVADISRIIEVSKHFYFEFTESSNEIFNILVTFMTLTVCIPPSWYSATFKDDYCKYNFKSSLTDDYNILKLCDSAFDCVSDGLVSKNIEIQEVSHLEQVSNNDILNKMSC